MKISAMLLALLCGFCAPVQAATPEPPNVLIILADDLGYSDLGCYGSEIATPHLDRLSAGGLRFTQFYNTARCWTTRNALLTGYYAQQVDPGARASAYPDWVRTLPQRLKPLGYSSYHSGKWHLQPRTALAGMGFDRSYRVDDLNRNFNPQKVTEDDRPLPAVPAGSGYYTTTVCADRMIGYLQEHARKRAGQPFFSYLAFSTPHFPLQAPPEDIARYRDKYLAGWDVVRSERHRRQLEMKLISTPLSALEPDVRAPSGDQGVEEKVSPHEIAYALAWDELTTEQQRFQATKMAIHAAMVDRIDREVGRVVAQLKAMDQLDNTLIMFLSDNGASAELLVRGDGHDPTAAPGSAESYLCLGPGWSSVSNTPLRRHKIWVHEGGVSTPLIVHWPNGIAARGELRHDVGHVVDIVPTILEMTGAGDAPAAGEPALAGQSLVRAFASDGAGERDFVFFHHAGNRGLRVGDWKLVSARDNGDAWELYNLAVDRAEMQNLAERHPDRVSELAARWQQLEDQFQRDSGAQRKPAAKKGRRSRQPQS